MICTIHAMTTSPIAHAQLVQRATTTAEAAARHLELGPDLDRKIERLAAETARQAYLAGLQDGYVQGVQDATTLPA